MQLRNIMKRRPATIGPSDPLSRAESKMAWGGYRHLPVVDGDGTLVGVLSNRDIIEYRVRSGRDLEDPVERAMSRRLHTAAPNDAVQDAGARMAANKIGCLPIAEDGILIGLVTESDLLAAAICGSNQRKGRPMRVRDVMTRAPHVIHADDRLLDAAARMDQLKIRHLPVVDADNRVIAMISDREVRTALGDLSRAYTRDTEVLSGLLRIEDVMSTPAVTIEPDLACGEAAALFARLAASAMPVVDEHGRLLGILSHVDLLRAFSSSKGKGSGKSKGTHRRRPPKRRSG